MQPFSIKQKKRDITFVNGNGFDSVKNTKNNLLIIFATTTNESKK